MGVSSYAYANPIVYNCSTGKAPSGFSGYNCNSICSVNAIGGGLYTTMCDVSDTSPTTDAHLHFVYNYPGSGSINFSAWGTTSDGIAFCCWIDDSGNQIFLSDLIGSTLNDTLSYQGDGKSMESPTAGAWAAHIFGDNGDDEITGATETQAKFQDYLYGEGNNDTIYGDEGNDNISGGSGNNYLYGGAGADIIRGGPNSDELYGGAGNNYLCGGGSLSIITGDAFNATNGYNTFWAPYSSLPLHGPTGSLTGGSSTCGHTSWGSSWVTGAGTCTYSITSAPSQCSGMW